MATTEELIRQMRAAGYRDEEIAQVSLMPDLDEPAEVRVEPSLADVMERLDQVMIRLERIVAMLYRPAR